MTGPTASTTTRAVVAETEAKVAVNGVYVGFTVYQVTADGADTFEVVVRSRTYDGIRVASKHDSAPIALAATDKDAAIVEGRGHALSTMDFLRAMATD